MRRRQSLEPNVRQHEILLPQLFLQFHHVLVLLFVQGRAAFATGQWVLHLGRRFLPVASGALALRLIVFRGARQPGAVRRAQVPAGGLLAVLRVGDRAVPVLPRSRESLGEGAAKPAFLLVVAAGRAGAAQRVQRGDAVRGQLSRHRGTLVVAVPSAAGCPRIGIAEGVTAAVVRRWPVVQAGLGALLS